MTVVTVCYNAVDTIEKTILSVINQTYSNLEYIIIDGASNDGTLDLIEKYRANISCLVSEHDAGVYDAMNKGIILATGNYINFMNAGDTFFNNEVIEKIVKNLTGNPDVIYGDVAFKMDGVMYAQKSLPPLYPMGFNHQSSFVASNYAKANLFDTNFKYAADYDMMYKAHHSGCEFLQLNMIISVYDTNGMSEMNRKQHKSEMLMIETPDKPLRNVLILEWFMLKWAAKKIIKYISLSWCPTVYHFLKVKSNGFYVVQS